MSGEPFAAFSSKLRDLRLDRGLSLSDVERLSACAAVDGGGKVSRAYVQQLEAGRDRPPSLSKLLTLASVYQLDPGELIQLLPRDERRRTLAELQHWRSAGYAEPQPLWWDPRHAADCNVTADALVRQQSRGVLVSLDLSSDIQDDLRRVLLVNALPAMFVDARRRQLLDEFWAWASCRKLTPKHAPDTESRAARRTTWRHVVLHLVSWLVYERRIAAEVLGDGLSWFGAIQSQDVSTWHIGCRYPDPTIQALFGHRALPASFTEGARWRMVARLIAIVRHSKARAEALAPPPEIDAAASEYITQSIGCPYAPDVTSGANGRARVILDAMAAESMNSGDTDIGDHMALEAAAFLDQNNSALEHLLAAGG